MKSEYVTSVPAQARRVERGGLDGPTVVLFVFAVVLAGGVFVLDLLTDAAVSAAALYSLVIFYCWLFQGSAPVVGVAALCSVLAVADVFLTRPASGDVAGVNKIISIGVIWVSAALVLFVKSSVKQIEETGKRLEVESVKFETALENAPNAVLMVDATGTILLVNRHAEILFGYARRHLIGESVDVLVPERRRAAHVGLRQGFMAELSDTEAGRSRLSLRGGRELIARRKDGTEVHVEIGLNPIETPSGMLVIASLVDISERKLAAALLEEQHRMEAERLTRELMLAEKIQTSILPRPPFMQSVDIAARMVPAAEVGGDYYDILPAEDGCWLAIGDVSGHGLDAGLVSLMVQSATSAILHSTPDIDPGSVIAGINATLYDNVVRRLGRKEYVTFSILRYRGDGSVEYAGAHQDILVWREATRQVERYPTKGGWLAIRSEVAAETARLKLDDGDLLVLFTDGLVESRSDAGDLLGIRPALELIHSRSDLPTPYLVDALIDQACNWSPKLEDDVTVVALRHRAKAG